MVDSIRVIPGSTTDPEVATDSVSGKNFQRIKLDVGVDGISSPVTGILNSGRYHVPVLDYPTMDIDPNGSAGNFRRIGFWDPVGGLWYPWTGQVSQSGNWQVSSTSGSASNTTTIPVVATAGGTPLFAFSYTSKSRVITNDSTVDLYISYGAVPPTYTTYRLIIRPKMFLSTDFAGAITGRSASGTINIQCSEDS